MKNIKINTWLKEFVVTIGLLILGGVGINAQYHVTNAWVNNGTGYFNLRADGCNNTATIQCIDPNKPLPPTGYNYYRNGTIYYPNNTYYQRGTGNVIAACAKTISSCNASVSNDLCDGPVTLSASSIGSSCSVNYKWSNGLSGQNITVSQAGVYTMTATDCNGSICTDQITVQACQTFLTCSIIDSGDLCRDGSVTLTANVTGSNCSYNYVWNTDSQIKTITVTQAGLYSYTAIDCNGSTCTAQITVLDEKPNGGILTFTSGGVVTTICNEDEPLFVNLSEETGTNQAWVITDESLNILDFPAGPPFTLNNTGLETCLIWNASYEVLQGAAIGQNAENLTGCFDLSNSIRVEKVAVEGGNLTFNDGSITQNICIDNEADPLFVNLTGESGGNQAWVITDEALNILDSPAGPPFDLNGAGVGTCLIWSVNYENLIGAQLGQNAGDLTGCFDLSNSIEVVRELCVVETAGLGDYTWIDSNQDGIQDPDEMPLDGILVQLYLSTDPNKTMPIKSTVTNANGYYEFIDLDPNLDYIVKFDLKEDYVLTQSLGNASDGNVSSSDADPITGSTDVIDLDPGEFDATIDAGYNLVNPVPLMIDLKLQGAIDPNDPTLMTDELRQNGDIPLTEPYSANPNFNHNGGETIDQTVLTQTGKNAIVDWILAEVRNPTNPNIVVASRAGLLQRDGDFVDVDGVSPVDFDVPAGEYHISISHRNHLSIMTKEPVLLDNMTPVILDFTSLETMTYGEYAQTTLNGENVMWAGSVNNDGQIIFQGESNDVNEIFFEILNSPLNIEGQLNFILEEYGSGDLNMDGQVIHQGINNDVNVIFFNVLSHPGNINLSPSYIIQEQMP